jgi:hypothetical protein
MGTPTAGNVSGSRIRVAGLGPLSGCAGDATLVASTRFKLDDLPQNPPRGCVKEGNGFIVFHFLHSQFLLRTQLASDSSNCWVAIGGCSHAARRRSFSWRRINSGTSSLAGILRAAFRGSSPRRHSALACLVEYAPARPCFQSPRPDAGP